MTVSIKDVITIQKKITSRIAKLEASKAPLEAKKMEIDKEIESINLSIAEENKKLTKLNKKINGIMEFLSSLDDDDTPKKGKKDESVEDSEPELEDEE